MGYVVLRELDAAIATNHPVRAAVLDVETYHGSIGKAIAELCDALDECSLRADPVELAACTGDSGYVILAIFEDGIGETLHDDPAGYVNFSWYTLESGTIEINAYVA